jgi:hypothetical protein
MCIFLMLSWAILPPSQTRRHYLSVCLVLGIILEAVGVMSIRQFVILIIITVVRLRHPSGCKTTPVLR